MVDYIALQPTNVDIAPIFKFASILDKLVNGNMKPKEQSGHANSINSKASILLADDDIDDRELFEDIIREIHPGIHIKSVADGGELMKLLTAKDYCPDLLFLDLNMPGKNGKQCLREIRDDARLNHLPVIIYSTSSLSQDITDTYQIGANLYFRKPNSYKVAMENLRKILAMDFENMESQPDIASYTFFSDKF